MPTHLVSVSSTVFSVLLLAHRLGAHDIKMWKTGVLKPCLSPVERFLPLSDQLGRVVFYIQAGLASVCPHWEVDSRGVLVEGDA